MSPSSQQSLRLVVASRNPVKLRAAESGFRRIFADRPVTAEGVAVPSGVSDQPMTDAETLQGAENRVREAAKQCSDADFWVGLEGGLEEVGGELAAFGWIVVRSANQDQLGRSRTASFALPPQVRDLVLSGVELGIACDQIFDRHNVKQSEGAVGLLTAGSIDRASLYEAAVVLALVPFINGDLYLSE